jgi:molybdopterin converting factor small subunit
LQVRVRLGAGLDRHSQATRLTVALDADATVAELYARLADAEPALGPVLPSTLPVIGGEQVGRDRVLRPGQEVALLLPISGG